MRDPSAHILVVDDSVSTLEVLERNLVQEGYVASTAKSVDEAILILGRAPVDLVITDLRMPKVGGLDLIRHVREHFPDTAAIMITGYSSIESAVAAVKEGAEEYLTKPFTDEELISAVQRTLGRLRQRRASQQTQALASGAPFGLIGESPAMQRVYRAIEKAAAASATVLITGESGTGKELVARAIHYRSSRASAPFVPVNCGGIPEGLVESELFGHVKGSFTGAITTRAGFFIAADQGCIFLDEVGELTPAMQAKLLRVLEDNKVQMVGAAKPRVVDVRVLAATNKDLAGLVRRKTFRDDLYFRLNVISIELPPLRDRGDDIIPLVGFFLAKFAREADKPTPRLSDRAWRCLREYHWPGNIRELENVVQRLVVMIDGDEIDAADLPSLLHFAVPRGGFVQRTLAEVEAAHIRAVLAGVNGNKTRAAQILGIDRKTLRESLKRFGFTTEASNSDDTE
ncbi:MAG: sigma-54-dependent Fis family transcriptional regulator [Phycisphaerales bacterium]|nr:sigma-54-dependent Fis family transcriptional regulator [Phycisphaerales bacterium]